MAQTELSSATAGTTTSTVVICAYTIDRWPDLQRAVRSTLAQEPPPNEVIVVVDHNTELLEAARSLWMSDGVLGAPGVRVIANDADRGLSGARNSGIAAATSEVIVFLDDDAEADRNWLAGLLRPYQDPQTAACGGAALPALVGTRPEWWPLEFDWVIGCSYRGLPTRRSAVRNLIGANMSVRRDMVVELGGFPEGIGRVGTRPVGCEETDLFIRLTQRWPSARILYDPAATVRHTVPVERLSWRYFRARCFAEGLSKALVAARVGSVGALASERAYTLKVLPLAVVRAIGRACRGERGAARRAAAIVAGLAITATGYAWGTVTRGAIRGGPQART